jgi:hypothetical protein
MATAFALSAHIFIRNLHYALPLRYCRLAFERLFLLGPSATAEGLPAPGEGGWGYAERIRNHTAMPTQELPFRFDCFVSVPTSPWSPRIFPYSPTRSKFSLPIEPLCTDLIPSE